MIKPDRPHRNLRRARREKSERSHPEFSLTATKRCKNLDARILISAFRRFGFSQSSVGATILFPAMISSCFFKSSPGRPVDGAGAYPARRSMPLSAMVSCRVQGFVWATGLVRGVMGEKRRRTKTDHHRGRCFSQKARTWLTLAPCHRPGGQGLKWRGVGGGSKAARLTTEGAASARMLEPEGKP